MRKFVEFWVKSRETPKQTSQTPPKNTLAARFETISTKFSFFSTFFLPYFPYHNKNIEKY